MLVATKKKELLKQAEGLADRLHRAGVSRAELRPILTALFLSPGDWPQRLERSQALLDTLPQSWVANRSGKTRSQLLAVGSTLRSVIVERSVEEESAFLLGWVARLVQLKDLEQRERG
jgi:hypothetical protein